MGVMENKQKMENKMKKDKYYRVTEKSGKKWKGNFDGKVECLGIDCFRFYFHSCIIEIDLIEKIEEVTVISPDTIAREQGCWDEYCNYLTVNGVKIRERYTYKEISFKNCKVMGDPIDWDNVK